MSKKATKKDTKPYTGRLHRPGSGVKKHRAIDWLAIVILISAAFVIASVLSGKIEQFSHDMDIEAKRAQAVFEFKARLENR